MQILRIATVILASLIASTAQADWDHTKWGQSLESLLEMEDYEVEKQQQSDKYIRTLDAHYGIDLVSFGRFTVKITKIKYGDIFRSFAWLNFENFRLYTIEKKLSAVVITVAFYDRILLRHLQDRYGAPDFTRRTRYEDCTKRTHFWRDDQSGNNIRLIDANCTERDDLRLLIYSPILTAENSRL